MRTLIKNSIIVSGEGHKSLVGNIEICDDTISKISDNGNTIKKKSYDRVLDVQRSYVAPGFIDIHSHTDLANFSSEGLHPKITQGVTTEVVGQCGFSAVPILRDIQRGWRNISLVDNDMGHWGWENVNEYFRSLADNGMDSNLVLFVGHGALRFNVVGAKNKILSKRELEKLGYLIDESFVMGAFGVSLGLYYVPGLFANSEELNLVAQRVAKADGIVSVHLRSEGDELISSLEEVCQLVEKHNVRLHISHLKTIGESNRFKLDEALRIIEKYSLTFDHYPYTAGSTILTALLPPWIFSEMTLQETIKKLSDPTIRAQIKDILQGYVAQPQGVQWDNLPQLVGWNNIQFLSSPALELKKYERRSIEQIANDWRCDPVDVVLDIITLTNGRASMLDFHSSEESIITKLKHPLSMVGSDIVMGDCMHPRCFGTYPKIISKYVFNENVISLEEAVMKMTSKPASLLGIKDRGIIKVGNKADLVVFTDEFRDQATYTKDAYTTGLKHLFINGQLKIDDGKIVSNSKPGVVINRNEIQ